MLSRKLRKLSKRTRRLGTLLLVGYYWIPAYSPPQFGLHWRSRRVRTSRSQEALDLLRYNGGSISHCRYRPCHCYYQQYQGRQDSVWWHNLCVHYQPSLFVFADPPHRAVLFPTYLFTCSLSAHTGIFLLARRTWTERALF